MEERTKINNQPDAESMWKGLGGHFNSFSQIINEFIDNSLSNFSGNKDDLVQETICLYIEERANNKVFASIEDSGTGIKDLDQAFTIGGQDRKVDSALNEHGYGFKHALATGNQENDNWRVYTRTKEMLEEGRFDRICAPYSFELYANHCNLSEVPWPGIYNGTGTYISFECSEALFQTVSLGVSSGGPRTFKVRVEHLIEDIGFTYADLISQGALRIDLIYKSLGGESEKKRVEAILPRFEKSLFLKTEPHEKKKKKLTTKNNQAFEVEYQFGHIEKSVKNRKYYKGNMSSLGVEIRVNGRLLEYNILEEIWHREKHNTYNYLIGKVNIIGSDPNSLPVTRTSKNGIRKGDPVLEALFAEIRKMLPDPKPKASEAQDEKDLFDALAKDKRAHLQGATIETGMAILGDRLGENLFVDLYVHSHGQTVIYEGKKDGAKVLDLWQLMMYVYGLAYEGIMVDEAILIASKHSESVRRMAEILNENDFNGKKCKIVLKTWRDERIDYP